jgi:hypothetical protein
MLSGGNNMKKGKDDLDLTRPKTVGEVLKIDPDPVLGRWDLLLFQLQRIGDAMEDLCDIMGGEGEVDDEGAQNAAGDGGGGAS